MRVVLLNTHWTTSRRLDEWLARTDWDVAVLLEVSRRAGSAGNSACNFMLRR